MTRGLEHRTRGNAGTNPLAEASNLGQFLSLHTASFQSAVLLAIDSCGYE